MAFLAELDAADPGLGGKARSLAFLAERGLATPPGFAVTDALFRALCPIVPAFERLNEEALASLDDLRERILNAAWPAGFRDELQARLGTLRATSFAVRSSFASEDLPGQLAPGVYESRGNVPARQVETALRQVLCSALAPGAVAYAMAHGEAPAKAPVAVLVHAFAKGDAEGSAAYAPGRMTEPLVMVRSGELPAPAKAGLCRSLVALATARGPVEIEWVWADGQMVHLQARPFEPPALPAPWSGFDELPGGSVNRAEWRWDAAHNPLPLSPAQAGLVELVDERCSIGVRQRVLGGYLFYRRDSRALPPAIATEDADSFFGSLQTEVEKRLAGLGAQPDLEEALALFLFAYEPIFGVLQPALRKCHENLREFLGSHAPAGITLLPALRTAVSSVASERNELVARIVSSPGQVAMARSDYLARFGDEAPMWDVSAATYAEEPDTFAPESSQSAVDRASLDWQAASAQVEAMLFPGLRERWRDLLGAARTAVSLGEADDWLYARTQAAVRRALLVVGRRLHRTARLRAAEDVFFLPLALVRSAATDSDESHRLVDLARLAAGQRETWRQACNHPPPLPDAPDAADGKAIRGFGTGGRAIGCVRWHRGGVPVSGATTSVLVAKTLLPTELPLMSALAVVTETGGPLDHVAAQARERRIPAVVGAQGASSVLREGDLVLVDGDTGLVVRLIPND